MRRTGPVLLTLLGIVVLAAGCGSDDRERPPPEWEQKQTAERQAGRDLFLRQGCGNCHTIDENDYVAKEGPDLSYYGIRPKSGGTVVRRMLHPEVPPTAQAPDHMKIADGQARELIAQYLTSLRPPEGAYTAPDYEGDRRLQSYCPVTGLRVDNDRAESRTYGGKTYYFATASAARKFDQAPDHFVRMQ